MVNKYLPEQNIYLCTEKKCAQKMVFLKEKDVRQASIADCYKKALVARSLGCIFNLFIFIFRILRVVQIGAAFRMSCSPKIDLTLHTAVRFHNQVY